MTTTKAGSFDLFDPQLFRSEDAHERLVEIGAKVTLRPVIVHRAGRSGSWIVTAEARGYMVSRTGGPLVTLPIVLRELLAKCDGSWRPWLDYDVAA